MDAGNSATNFALCIPAEQLIDSDISTLDGIATRSILFYDESVFLYIEFDVRAARLKGHQIDCLTINVNAKVQGGLKIITSNASSVSDGDSLSSHTRKSQIRSFDIATLTVTSDCLVFSDDDRAIWKTPILLQHPRMRLTDPVINITVVANLEHSSSIDELEAGPTRSRLLKSMEPIWGPNYFASLDKKYSYYEKDKNKRAAASEKNVADNSFSSHNRDIRGIETVQESNFAEQLSVPIQAAMNLTIMPSTKRKIKSDDLVVLLELNVHESSKHSTLIEHVSLTFPDGSASLIGCQQLPLLLMPGECVLLSYRLVLSDISGSTSKKRLVSIAAKGRPMLDTSGPLVVANWDTTVDFDEARTSSLSASTRTPTNVSIDSGPLRGDSKRGLGKIIKTGSTPALLSPMGNFRNQSPSGVSVIFSGPTSVKVGEEFIWKAFAVNHCSVLKNFSLIFQGPSTHRNLDVSEKVLSQLGGYSVDRRQNVSETVDMGLLSLVTDVRLPTLHPMGCAEVEIKLLAMCEGVHTIDGVMLVDLTSGDTVECENLLDVVVSR